MIKWSNTFSVHNEKVDAQHKMLFAIANRVFLLANRQATANEIKEVLKRFFDYMAVHFKEEEKYMEKIGYPKLEEHKSIHNAITKQMFSIVKEATSLNEVKEKLNVVARKWLLEHILKEDMKVEKYRRDAIVANSEVCDLVPELLNNIDNLDEYDIVEDGFEEGEEIDGFYYTCACPNKIHDVPDDIHYRIAKGASFRCKACQKALVYKTN